MRHPTAARIARTPPATRARSIVAGCVALLCLMALASCASMFRSPQPASVRVLNDAAGEPRMRVRIATEAAEARFGATGDVVVDNHPGLGRPVTLRSPVRVRLGESGWIVTDHGGATRHFDRGQPLALRHADGADIAFGETPYPGVVLLHTRPTLSPGVFDVVNHVPIERYLPGVVAKELYPNWHAAAFETQAIAARSYALHERQRRMGRGDHFDIESTDRDQVYGGATTNQTALRAVEATRGLVLTYRGHLLRAYYSSTCGGRPGSARDTWPTGRGFEYNLAAPLQGREREHACQTSPLYAWTVERSTDDVLRRVQAWGAASGYAVRNMASLARVEVFRRNEAGRAAEFRLYDAQGKWWALSAEQFRNASNHPATGLPNIVRETRIHSGDVEVRIDRGRVAYTGRGFGHGVGMCQFCTQTFATRGESARGILARFYPDTSIETRY